MVKMIENKKVDDGWFLAFEFHLFGGKLKVVSSATYDSKKIAKDVFLHEEFSLLKINFERYIFLDNGPMSEDAKKSKERLLNANRYFCETEDMSLHKICSMILKLQKEMLSLLSTKNEHYARNFEYLNQLIGFCKETINKESDNTTT